MSGTAVGGSAGTPLAAAECRPDALRSAVVITPSPESGAGATRRFCERASVRVLPTDVVVTNAIGEESWYARSGPNGIARLMRLTDPRTRAYLGVELRDADGEARAPAVAVVVRRPAR